MNGQSLTHLNRTLIPISIEPFGRKHDRTGFVCGNTYIDAQLQRSIIPLVELNLSRAFVAAEPNSVKVLGFYAMHSHTIEPWKVPPQWESIISDNNLGGIPAAYISLFATTERCQGRGIGRLMMADALRRIKAASEALGTFAVVLDAADQKAFDFYSSIGFLSMEQNLRMFYLVAEIP